MLARVPDLPRRTWLLSAAVLLAVAAGIALFLVFRPHNLAGSPDLAAPGLPNAPDGAQVLLAVGDIGSCSSEADAAVARLAASLPGEIALLGDNAYPDGTASDYERCFAPDWSAMRDRMRPVPGNHEYNASRSAAPYFAFFGSSAGPAGQGWYSYDLGAWHVVALNSNCDAVGGCGEGSVQLQWLREDLAAHPSSCLLAYWHHPRWSSGRHGNAAFMDGIWQLLVGAGADVVLNGHDHSYERLRTDGVREFVVGTGGRSLYAFDSAALPATEARHQGSYGLLWLALSDGSYEWQFLPLGATTFTDSGQGDCGE